MAKKPPTDKPEGRLTSKLRSFVKSGGRWEVMITPVPNVTIVRGPETKTKPPILYLGFNPQNDKKSIFPKPRLFKDREQFDILTECIEQEDVDRLFEEIKIVNDENVKKKDQWEITEI